MLFRTISQEILCFILTILFGGKFLSANHDQNWDFYASGMREQPLLEEVFIPGDIILGGLFRIHESCQERAKKDICDAHFSRSGFQVMQAMLMAVKQVNEDTKLLPGLTIGVHIKDTCGNVDIAVREVLNFSFVKRHVKSKTSCSTTKKHSATLSNMSDFENATVAIIGPEFSENARAVADLASLFNIPVVSPSATSELLSDRRRFRHFFRTVPPDGHQAQVIIDLILHFKWNFIVLLSSNDEYGRSGRSALLPEFAKRSICTDIDEVITEDNLYDVISDIQNKARAKVIVAFLTVDYLVEALNHSKFQNLTGFTWLVSDTWIFAQLTTRNEALVSQSMLAVRPKLLFVPGYKKELNKVINDPASPWESQFICSEKKFCKMKNLSDCIEQSSYELSPYVGPTFDAVFAVAFALHKAMHCTKKCMIASLKNGNGDLVNYLQNVKFPGISGRMISFEDNGAATGAYQVIVLQNSLNDSKMLQIANWTCLHNNGTTGNFQWISQSAWTSTGSEVPVSNCSTNCQAGEYRAPQKMHPRCCWECRKCGGETITETINADQCAPCEGGFTANDNKTSCIPLQMVFMKWSDAVSKIIIILAGLGISLIVATVIAFNRFKNTAVIKAACESHCYLLLLGVISFELLPFAFIGKPTIFTCNLKIFLLGFCFSLNVGTILVKANHIAKSVTNKPAQSNRNTYKRQTIVILCIIVVEELICLVWILALDKPSLQTVSMGHTQQCQICAYGESYKGIALWSCYNAGNSFLGLILVCTYQTVLVRKAPRNHNEAKFLLFTMLSICIIILVYIPIFIGTVGYIKDTIFCFFSIFMGIVEFFCIIAPKLYIIFFRPHKNV